MRRVTLSGAGALAALIAAVALPATGAGATSCTTATDDALGASIMKVDHSAGDATVLLRRVPSGTGSPVVAALENGAPLTCSGGSRATDVVGEVLYENSGGTSQLIVEDAGTFLPGAGGLSNGQIVFGISETGGSLNQVVLRDGDGVADTYHFSHYGPAGPNGYYMVDFGGGPASLGRVDMFWIKLTVGSYTVEGSPQADVINGAGVDDTAQVFSRPLTVRAGAGADAITGGSASDIIDPGPGDDAVDGGDGTDRVEYDSSPGGVDVDLVRPAPQAVGAAGADRLTRVEDLSGSPFNDVLRGDDGLNTLSGGAGDDVVEGRGGADLLTGGPGSDTLSYASATAPVTVDLARVTPDAQQTGGAGLDTLGDVFEGLVGGQGADSLRGTIGPDVIEGGPGADTIRALSGDDRVLLRDGAPDIADCGDGLDRAEVDPGGIDAVVGCEGVTVGVAPGIVPTGGGGAGGGTGAGTHRVAARLAGAKAQRLVKGGVAVKVTCPLLACGVRASATATLKKGTRTRKVAFRPARARLAAGASATLALKLPASGLTKVRSALAGGSRPVVRTKVVVTDAAGGTKTLTRNVTLKR